MATKKTEGATTVEVMEVSHGVLTFLIKGEAPFICNAMSAKIKHELLLPRGKKNAAEKSATLKHNPPREWLDSMYKFRDDAAPTRIYVPATAFKGALMSAALDLPDVAKAQIGRLCYVVGDRIPIFGVPQLLMAVTRSADMKKTPDVRTRAILPEWACRVDVRYTKPILREKTVINLLSAAGMTQGVGDWRVQKGSGNYGQFRICPPDDADFLRIIKDGGRAAQDAALAAAPVSYDSETDSLLDWFYTESKRRGFKEVA